jgi:hypothetical protein
MGFVVGFVPADELAMILDGFVAVAVVVIDLSHLHWKIKFVVGY